MEKNLQEYMKQLALQITKEKQEMWRSGFAEGSVTTCAVLYKTLLAGGVEESNVIFLILKDIAAKQGCTDLKKIVEEIGDAK